MALNPLHEKWIKMGYYAMPPLNFECVVCKLPAVLKRPPKEDTLYRCDGCLSWYIFSDITENDKEYNVKIRRVRFKTRELEKEYLEKHKK